MSRIFLLVLLLALPFASADKTEPPRTGNTIRKRKYQEHGEQEYPQSFPQRPAGCNSCKMREEIKLRNLEVIKGEILKRMGFSQAPNITGKVLPQIPPNYLEMVEGYGVQSDSPYKTGFSVTEEEDEYHVKTQKVITFAQSYPRMRHSWKGHQILYFMFTDTITKFHVANATLFVFIKGTEKKPSPDVLLEVFKVRKMSEHADSPALTRVHARKITQPNGRGHWVKIDFTVTVSEWFKGPRDNFGFVVNATVNGKKVVVTDVQEKNSKAPFVEISTMEPKRRLRRNLGLNCDEKMNEPLCCRYSLIVDFEEIGFDFIIAPKKYDAHMCSGDCPFVTLQKNAHTHLMQLASPGIAAPCCAPRKMSSISMLYFDEQLNVVYGSLPGMVVDRCGCS